MPLLADKNQIAIKQEAAAGTAEALANTDVKLCTQRPEIDFDFAMTEREALTASLSPRGSVRGTRMGTIRFKMFLRGTATAPVAGSNEPDFSVPFKGCGAQVTVSGAGPNEQSSFKPNTTIVTNPAAGYCTLAAYVDGKRYQLVGAVGNCVLTLAVGAPVLAEFEFKGRVANLPTDTALLATPTYPTVIEPAFLNASLSMLSYATPYISRLTLDFGNEIVMRPDPNNASGFFTAQITRRRPHGSFDPEETLAATKNWWNEWSAGTLGSIATGTFPSSGGSNYNQFSLTVPNAQYAHVGFADRDGIVNAPVDYICRANSDAGDDEWELIQT